MYPERDTKLLRKRQTDTANYYNRGERSLSELSDSDVVHMKPFRLGDKEWRKATVTSRLDERSYTVETPEGDTYRRNRVHLKKTQRDAIRTNGQQGQQRTRRCREKRYVTRTWFSKTHRKNSRSQWKLEGILSYKEHDHTSKLKTTANQEFSRIPTRLCPH